MNLAELSRRVENMIRFGTIAEVNHDARRVRVSSGELTTDWLKWRAGRAGATRTWDPPTLGEQVMVLSPSGVLENGIVVPSIYSDVHDAPDGSPDTHVTQYPDGAVTSYNHVTHVMAVSGIKDLNINATGNVNITNEGNTVVNTTGKADVTAGGKATVTAPEVEMTDGSGSKGCVQGDSLCSFTGKQHPHVSATVKASK